MKTAALIIAFTAAPALAQVKAYSQCGGSAWTGETDCEAGWQCVAQNDWFHQCVALDSGSDETSEVPGDSTSTDENSGSDECEDEGEDPEDEDEEDDDEDSEEGDDDECLPDEPVEDGDDDVENGNDGDVGEGGEEQPVDDECPEDGDGEEDDEPEDDDQDDECPDGQDDEDDGDEDDDSDDEPAEDTPVQSTISPSTPVQTASIQPTSVHLTSIQPSSVQATPIQSSSVQATPRPSTGADCGSASTDQLVGFGSGTTGGGEGDGTSVSSCEELSSALENGGVIKISGTLNGCDILEVNSDTSILGVGADAGFVGSGLRLKGITNVIIRNLKFHQSPEGKDLIDIETSTYIWVDHCEFSNDGIEGDKDFYDGQLDIKRASDFITVSWCNFLDHWKASLIGHSESNGDQDTGTFHVTYHHNYWNNINSRTPSIRFGTVHIYSSCYEDIPTSGVNSREGAQVLVEETSFTNAKKAIVTFLDADKAGYATERNNLFNSSPIDITQEGSFEPEYSYTTDPVDCVCSLLKSSAGVGVIG